MARRVTKTTQKPKRGDMASAFEYESEFMLKVEEGSVELDVNTLQKLHLDELLEIRDFIDSEKEPKLYANVCEAIRLYQEPKIQIARLDERVWSYFYEKYFLRLLLLLWFAVVFFLVKPSSLANFTLRNPTVTIAAIGAGLVIFLWRIFLAYWEARFGGMTPLRRKLGIRVVTAKGKPPGFFTCLFRGFLKAFPWYFITLLTMEIDKNNRGLHDRLFGTYVLRVKDEKVSEAELALFIKENF